MKKTIHINLSGMAFTIEEDAYERLSGYLKAVEERLGGGDEAEETINDIEARMAELFGPVVHHTGAAIRLEDVEEVIKVLGNPDDYVTEEENAGKKTSTKTPPVYIPKRLYRDPHNKILGGVCAGLGTYFNIDPVIFRLLFIVGLFYGVSILPYIILWIAIPKALTMEQRMQMYGGDAGWSKSKPMSTSPRIDGKSDFDGFLRVVGIIIGVFLILATFITLVGLTMVVLFSGSLASFIPDGCWINEFPALVVGETLSLPAMAGVLLFVGIPVLMLFFLGLQLIFRFQKGGKAIGVIGLLLWLAGIGLIIYSGVNIATQFSRRETVAEAHVLDPFRGDTLWVTRAAIPDQFKGRRVLRADHLQIWAKNGNLSVEGRPRIEVIKNAPRFALTIEKSARGKDSLNAVNNAADIEYLWMQKDSVLELDRLFTLNREALLREQEVRVILEVPQTKEVVIDKTMSMLVW